VVANCFIADNTGEIKIVAWNDKAVGLKSSAIQQGQIIRVIGDYAKMGRDGDLEVHVGKKGKIILAPNDLNGESKKQLEQIERNNKKPKAKGQVIITKKTMTIDTLVNTYSFIKTIQGQVHIEEFKEVIKKDGDKIFLLKLNLIDDSGSVLVNIWGDTAEEMSKLLEDGFHIQLRNISCKMNTYTNQKELYFTRNSTIQIL
jgi:ssDNA-binding replication factor A large subunit